MPRTSTVLAVLALLAACGDGSPTPVKPDGSATPPADATTPDAPGATASVARGKYLVENVASCSDCHTPRGPDGAPDMTRFLAGAECFIDVNGGGAANGGCLNSRNLTNHATGLMNRSDDEIRMMFQVGTRPNGQHLNAVMPYWIFKHFTETDAQSIVLYLRTVPGVDHTVPASDPQVWPPPAQAAPPLEMAKVPAATPANASMQNGRYLAAIACLECHTRATNPADPRAIDETMLFAGNRDFPRDALGLPPVFPEHIYTANLTSHATGLAGWTAADIAKVLKEGHDREGNGICPPMPVGPRGGFGGLSASDINDIAAYILSLAPIDNAESGACAIPAN